MKTNQNKNRKMKEAMRRAFRDEQRWLGDELETAKKLIDERMKTWEEKLMKMRMNNGRAAMAEEQVARIEEAGGKIGYADAYWCQWQDAEGNQWEKVWEDPPERARITKRQTKIEEMLYQDGQDLE
jgi:hypothetical protein